MCNRRINKLLPKRGQPTKDLRCWLQKTLAQILFSPKCSPSPLIEGGGAQRHGYNQMQFQEPAERNGLILPREPPLPPPISTTPSTIEWGGGGKYVDSFDEAKGWGGEGGRMGTNRFMIGKINIRIYVLVNTSKEVRIMCLMTRIQKKALRRHAIADV